jgi:hypothetical protein
MVAAGVLAATAPRAHGQDNVFNPNATATDSTEFTTPGYRFVPLFTNSINGGVSSVSMVNEFSSSITTPRSLVLNFGLMKNEKYYRLNDNSDLSKRLSLNGFYPLRYGMTSSLGYSDSRVSNRSAVVGGSFQDFIINDNGFNGGLTYNQRFPGLRLDAAANASAMNGERTYKTDQTIGGGVNGGVAANVLGNRVIVQARGAYRGTDETSRTTLSVFDGLGASEDSLSSVVRVFLSDSISVRASYSAYNGVRDYADQLQGSLGGQIPGEENVFQEREERSTRFSGIGLNSLLWTDLLLTLDVSHDEQLSDYLRQTTRFSENVTDAVRGSVSYTMPWRTTALVSFETTEALRNLGPQSVSSFSENRKRVGVGFGHSFTPTFRIDLNGSTQLAQSYYLDYDANPRDRDQVDNLASLRISSQLYKDVSANISLSYASTQYYNIDKSQSRNNRLREHYELRPGFSWYYRPWLTITQAYGLVIEYTDYDFVPEDNFLDRNLIFNNSFLLKPYAGMAFRFDYQLYVHDKGSYLPTGANGEDVLNVDTKDRRNQLLLRLDYNFNDRVALFAENRYNQFVDRAVSSGVESVSTDGQVQVGTTGNFAWSKGRKLTFMLARVKRFSPSGSDKEKDYWDMRSELNFPL